MLSQRLVYVGTYSEEILFGTGQILRGQGKGIYAYRFDPLTGALAPIGIMKGVRNPSYLALDPSRRFLYCVNEVKEFEGAETGAVSAFKIDPETGMLTLLNMKASHGTDPCHLILDATGKIVIIANFASGSVCVLPVNDDGSLNDPSRIIQHQGSSVDPLRQAGPHAHAVAVDIANRYVFVPDLGLDK
jgi:6-phosphogluconolactonase